MPIEVKEETIPYSKIIYGSETFTLNAGQSIKIETSPAGEEYLDREVPVGKSWVVIASVYITETSL